MSVHIPPEAVHTPRRRFLDWRFLAALTCLLLVVVLAVGAYRNYEIRQAEVEQRDRLMEQVEDRAAQVETLEGQLIHLQGRINGLHDKARADRRESRQERRLLLRQQAFMIRLLQKHGIVPRNLSGPVAKPSTNPRTRSSQPRSSQSTHSSKPKPKPPQGKSPRRPPEVTAGKSGKTPKGKAKGLRRGPRGR